MKVLIHTMSVGLSVSFFVMALSAGNVSAQKLHVDSVTVDSVWASDGSWLVGGVAQDVPSRDCKISFIPQGEGAAIMSVSMSTDSGKTFSAAAPTDSLVVLGWTLYSPLVTGTKAHITVRVLGGDQPGVSFKMTARQEAPVISGHPKTVVLGPTGALTPGADVQPAFKVVLAGDSSSYGYSTIAKVFWDTLGDGAKDSTMGVNVLTWTWSTQVPAGASAQTRNVIAIAVDQNGWTSDPETLSVQFGLQRQIVMKDIPGGIFSMGEASIADTVHQVTVSAFAMQETPVTQEQYLAVMGVNPAYSVGDLTRPVETVSWYDAVLYCNALSNLSGLDTCYTYTSADASDAVCDFAKQGYRLPTEAEWEYACRAGTTTTYWWGSDTTGFSQYVYYPTYNSGTTTTAVATTSPNAFGLYDMTGNGWKWCNDWFFMTYSSSAAFDPKGPATGSARVMRGGAWIGSFFVLENYYRSATRVPLAPSTRNEFCGFSCVQSR
jgi:formylglycine-generating enzyme required for sulfatase activity